MSIEVPMSLSNQTNYKETLTETSSQVAEKYTNIIIEYLHFITKYSSNPNKNYIKFIFLRGLDTISHIFIHILYYTKNTQLTEHHSQKSIYYYLEFIGQISEDKHVFLQLRSQDAVMYVYKKTIYDLLKKYKFEDTPAFIQTMKNIEKITQIYKNILSENDNIISSSQNISNFENLCKKIIKSPDLSHGGV